VTLAKNETHRALLLMAAAATLFGLMAFSAKVASSRIGGPQVPAASDTPAPARSSAE